MKRTKINSKHQRGEWRLHSANGLRWLAMGGTVRRMG